MHAGGEPPPGREAGVNNSRLAAKMRKAPLRLVSFALFFSKYTMKKKKIEITVVKYFFRFVGNGVMSSG